MWTATTTHGQILEALTLLRAQGVIDDYTHQAGDPHPYRVTIPVGIVPLSDHQARFFLLGAATAHFGPMARETPDENGLAGRH